MKTNLMTQVVRKISKTLCVLMCVLTVGLGFPELLLNTMPAAVAAPYQLASTGARDQIEGTAKQVQGRAQQDLGRTKGAINDAGNQVEGKVKRDLARTKGAVNETKAVVKGRAERDAARTQSAIEQAGAKAEQHTSGIVDTVKDFFAK